MEISEEIDTVTWHVQEPALPISCFSLEPFSLRILGCEVQMQIVTEDAKSR